MNPTMTFQPCSNEDLHAFLAEVARIPIEESLVDATAMQRLRITSLPDAVMERLCASLQGDGRWVCRMLADGAKGPEWKATATKIIEHRNTLEVPLLVFIPSGLRTAAEDSLDIATFTELSLSGLTRNLADTILAKLPETVRTQTKAVIDYLRLQKTIKNSDEEVEFLLTILKNGATGIAVGHSLYVFRLVPDDTLLNHPNPLRKLSLNIRASEELSNLNRPLRERIARLPVRPGTVQKPLFTFLRSRHAEAPRLWAGEIATDPAQAHLNFCGWDFDEGDELKLRLVLEPLGLPVQAPDAVGGSAQMPVLDLTGKQPLKVSLRSLPKPAEVPGWKSFRVQLLSVGEDGPSVAWESNSYPKPGGRNQKFTRTIKTAEVGNLEEGTYFLKVDAYDQNGALLTERRPVDPDRPDGRAENESDFFFVTSGLEQGDVDVPPPRVTRVPSLLDAYFIVAGRQVTGKSGDEDPQREALTGSWSQPANASLRGDVYFELEGPDWQGYGVVVPGVFRRLELSILKHPDQLGLLRLDCVDAKDTANLQVERRETASLPDWPESNEFLAARSDAFLTIHGQHLARSGAADQEALRAGVVETADLLAAEAVVRRYARSYLALAARLLESESIHRSSPGALKGLAQMDTVEVIWRRATGDPGRALLLSPTHPLRILWHLQHALVCDQAISNGKAGHQVPSWPEFLRQIRMDVIPACLPLVLFDSRGRGYVDHGSLTLFWSLYLPEGTHGDRGLDVSGCRDRVRRLLGIRFSQSTAGDFSDKQIAAKAADYLEQHPYVEQLRINVFNPGDGQLLVEAIRTIEREQVARRVPDSTNLLRYSIQMFGEGDAHLEGMGEALDLLLDPERQSAEGDEFTLATTNHLLPKLVFARNTVADFLKAPTSYPAHITIFLEHFNARSKLSRIDTLRRGAFVAGLIQEPEIALDAGDQRFHWSKGVRPAAGRVPFGAEAELCNAHALAQRLQAAVAAGQPQAIEIAPVVSLHLDAAALSLLKHSHEVSDWVVTIDRHLGVEYFDSGRASEEFGYLLDFSPATLQVDRPRVMLSTRSSWEIAGLLHPVFDRLGWSLSACRAEVVLESLRSLSGRLAFRLLGSPHHVSETVGLLLARWLMDRAGLLADRIIIPLDAHQVWFRRRADESAEGIASSQRADLLLVGFDPPTSTVRMTVVEVKLRENLSQTERGYLYTQMREQSENTVRWLRERFDPELYPELRVDAEISAKELATTLSFYIRRGHRYGLIGDEVERLALEFVENLDAGYRLDLRTAGVVFEQAAAGSHEDEDEPGFEVYRFGADVAQKLFDAVTSGCDRDIDTATDPSRQTPEISDKPERLLQVPVQADEPVLPEFDSFRSAMGGQTTLYRSRPRPSKQPPVVAENNEEPAEVEVAPPPLNEPLVPTEKPALHNPLIEQRTLEMKPSLVAESSLTPQEPVVPSAASNPLPVAVRPDVLLGAGELTSQYGILGRFGEAKVAVDLSGCNTISLFGVQGFGKSYTLGVVAEMATQSVAGINALPFPLATVIFHYHKSDAYAPEFATATSPNRKPREVEALLREYGARPEGLKDVVLLTPEAKLEQRKKEFPALEVLPIQFNSGELGAESWKFLLGAYGNDSLYVRQLVAIMRRHRQGLTFERFEQEIRDADLSAGTRRLAEDRINLARPYINDAASLCEILRPGRTVIVDLRDEWIEKEEALGLFVVMMRIFASSKFQGKEFNKLVVFDEAHKYITESDLIGQVVETIREMRHQATSVLIASQDPLSVPRAVVELSSIMVLHRMTSPQWLKHLKSAVSALEGISESNLSTLQPGEALIWAQRSTDKRFFQRPQKVTMRPRFSQHGGGTKTAVEGETVR